VIEGDRVVAEVARAEEHVLGASPLLIRRAEVLGFFERLCAVFDPTEGVTDIRALELEHDPRVLGRDAQEALELHDVRGHRVTDELVVPERLEARRRALGELRGGIGGVPRDIARREQGGEGDERLNGHPGRAHGPCSTRQRARRSIEGMRLTTRVPTGHPRSMSRLVLHLLVLTLVTASIAEASVSEALPLDALVRQSAHVVHARTVRSNARFEGNVIVTTVVIEVIEAAKGRARPGTTLTLAHLGGAVGDVGMRVEGAPSLPVGSENVVFATEIGGRLTPVGMSQGVMPVRVENGRRQVMPGGAGLALVTRGRTGSLEPSRGALTTPRALGEVLDEVRALEAAAR
jgi:hypothetical protein